MFLIIMQTITHVKVDTKLELRNTIIYCEVEVALAGIPVPQLKNFIKFAMKIVSFFLRERHRYSIRVVILQSLKSKNLN